MRFKVITAADTEVIVLSDVTPCEVQEIFSRFGGTFYLLLVRRAVYVPRNSSLQFNFKGFLGWQNFLPKTDILDIVCRPILKKYPNSEGWI